MFRQLQADFGLLLEHCAQLTRKNDLLLQEKREDKEKIRALENLVEEKDGKIDKVVKDHVKALLEENEKKDIRLRQQRAYEKEITGLKKELKESQKQKETLKKDIDVLKLDFVWYYFLFKLLIINLSLYITLQMLFLLNMKFLIEWF